MPEVGKYVQEEILEINKAIIEIRADISNLFSSIDEYIKFSELHSLGLFNEQSKAGENHESVLRKFAVLEGRIAKFKAARMVERKVLPGCARKIGEYNYNITEEEYGLFDKQIQIKIIQDIGCFDLSQLAFRVKANELLCNDVKFMKNVDGWYFEKDLII